MNGTEQKAHTKATDALAKRLFDLELIVAALDERVSGVASAAHASIGQERTHRLTLADQQRSYVDNEDRQLRQSVERFRDRTLWGRLRWICFGT